METKILLKKEATQHKRNIPNSSKSTSKRNPNRPKTNTEYQGDKEPRTLIKDVKSHLGFPSKI